MSAPGIVIFLVLNLTVALYSWRKWREAGSDLAQVAWALWLALNVVAVGAALVNLWRLGVL